MANIQSLKPFQSSHDPRRNTNGRPKGSLNISTTLKEMLKRKVATNEGFTTIEKGAIQEKRELMQSFTSRLILINKRVVLE